MVFPPLFGSTRTWPDNSSWVMDWMLMGTTVNRSCLLSCRPSRHSLMCFVRRHFHHLENGQTDSHWPWKEWAGPWHQRRQGILFADITESIALNQAIADKQGLELGNKLFENVWVVFAILHVRACLSSSVAGLPIGFAPKNPFPSKVNHLRSNGSNSQKLSKVQNFQFHMLFLP